MPMIINFKKKKNYRMSILENIDKLSVAIDYFFNKDIIE
jgi:hypothetical protein